MQVVSLIGFWDTTSIVRTRTADNALLWSPKYFGFPCSNFDPRPYSPMGVPKILLRHPRERARAWAVNDLKDFLKSFDENIHNTHYPY